MACVALAALLGAAPTSAAPNAQPEKHLRVRTPGSAHLATAAAAPHQVQISFAAAAASDADVQASSVGFSQISLTMPTAQKISLAYASGAPALTYLQALTKAGIVSATQSVTVADDAKAIFNLSGSVSSGQAGATALAVTPRINSDGTLTLALFPVCMVDAVTHPLSTSLTLANGSTLMLVLPFANTVTGEGNTLLFVTAATK